MATNWRELVVSRTATLEPIGETPAGDLGFGSDLWCTDDITPDALELPGDDSRIVAQAAYRRLITPRGALIGEDDYGIDVTSYLHRGMNPQTQRELEGVIKGELLKDDRIDPSLSVVVAYPNPSRIDITITGQTAIGPFDLVLALTDAGLLLTEIRGNGD